LKDDSIFSLFFFLFFRFPAKTRIPGSKSLKEVLKTDDEEFLDFLTKCLSLSPEARLTPEQGLEHPWLSKVYESPAGLDKSQETDVSEPSSSKE